MDKPSLASGTRDFAPWVLQKRKFLMQIIERHFQLFGFVPLETPALENLKTLTGKYGEEGDQLLFKILNSGDFLAKTDQELLQQKDSKKITSQISDRGLRYDLTIPLARFVVMNRDKIVFPFKRYQMQPVWRADRPQKGRYREFWQCDADIVGSKSIANDAELILLYDAVFSELKIPVTIKINNRKIFDAFSEFVGGKDALIQFMQIIDKADKIELDVLKLQLELINKNCVVLYHFISTINEKSNDEKIELLVQNNLIEKELLNNAVSEIRNVLNFATSSNNSVQFDLTLARGLSYYTGTIYEVICKDKTTGIGSIGGGGRYDNLTEVFGLKDVQGVGISFGLDRIFDVMEILQLFPSEQQYCNTKILFCPMMENALDLCFNMANELRKNNIATDIFSHQFKLQKQLNYANDLQIPYTAIIGENEIIEKKCMLKNMQTGEQKLVTIFEIIHILNA